ncbi:MAG: Uma2 family endonuclease [Leptolyngbyaceae cyanobacterium SM1_1_3]|nr:Uma2 family endonuclease [Leptolyngbyaceae cyanobacterium SM1_1_3]NJM85085.1 Uma2 family endonuclease [Leptolyngbyaceae cyanobacterium RM2_2_21]NJN02441.1 Uma2 family endonuclease [Leptolyngbyaceae cyanobacterium RM1_1_2]NJO10468.1 Uma2 family endonuclease [Leptolyngbyaceae cyanobacterium SL_1_1]
MVTHSPRQSPTRPPLPPLESGDRLTRPEFEQRYAADPDIQKAELIEGIVYVASPLRFQQHAEPHSRLHGWLWTYQVSTPGLRLGIEPTVRLDLDNELQPDIVLILDEAVGGGARLSPDGYLEGMPELVVEIAASSAAIDLGSKQQVYRRSGVLEYIVWQSFEQRLDWFHLVEGAYQLLQPDADGILRSQAFPGLWLAAEALLNNQMAQVLEILQQGIASPEHTAFAQKLRQLSEQAG